MLATCQDIDSPLADEEAFQKGLHLCASKMHNFPVVHPDHGRPAAAGAQTSKTDLATKMVLYLVIGTYPTTPQALRERLGAIRHQVWMNRSIDTIPFVNGEGKRKRMKWKQTQKAEPEGGREGNLERGQDG